MAKHDSNTIITFAEDRTVVGLITYNDETAYREEVRDLAVWCQDNNLSITIKTKEMIMDYRKSWTEHAPILNDGAVVEQVGTEHAPLTSPRVEDQCHLGVACQEVQDPVAEDLFIPRVLSLVMSFEGTMVLNAELWSMNSILT